MKHFIFAIAIFLSTLCFTQTDIVLKGKVVDVTGYGVPTASVRIPKYRVSGYTDLNGEFSLTIQQSYAGDTVVVASIGFVYQYIPVKEMSKTAYYVVTLKEEDELLEEVEISFDKKENDPFRIVREVLKRRITNYPTEPQSYGMFYRAAYQENGRYVHYMESIKDVYDRSFGIEFTKKADVLEGHKAVRMTADSSKYPVVGDRDRFAMVVMKSWDEIRSKVLLLEDDVLGNWVFQIDSVWFENGTEKYYQISGKLSKNAASAGSVQLYKLPDEIIMTIEAERYALRKLECAYQMKRWLPNMRDTRGYSVKAISSKTVHKFKWINERLYLDYAYFQDNYQAFHRKTDSVLANYTIEDEAFFTGVLAGAATEKVLAFPYDHQFKFPFELYKVTGAYDAEPWKETTSYDSDFYQAVVADMGSPEELEAVFKEQAARAVAYQTCYMKYRYEMIPLDEKEVIMEQCILKEMAKK